jgi:hypothetical protein
MARSADDMRGQSRAFFAVDDAMDVLLEVQEMIREESIPKHYDFLRLSDAFEALREAAIAWRNVR